MSELLTAPTLEKPAGEIRQRNEKLIIEAAAEEFAAFGYKGASMREIARRAELPKANIHYYFKSKQTLYRAVLSDILNLWDSTLSSLTPDDDPAQSLKAYIRRKIEFSRDFPLASKIFAIEIISGGPNLDDFFNQSYVEWFNGRVAVFKAWQAQGKLNPEIDPAHLIFMLWSSTQHYADFQYQASAALGKSTLEQEDYDAAVETLTRLTLRGCGLSG